MRHPPLEQLRTASVPESRPRSRADVTESPVVSADIEMNCQRIADYLLDLAREDEIEPALDALLDALDTGMKSLERDARLRAERIHEALFRNHIAAQEQRLRGEGVDPYFWG